MLTRLQIKTAGDGSEHGDALELDVKGLSDQGEFEGYASTFGNVDRGNDIVVSGCFQESLNKRPAAKVKMLLHHDPRRICGVWTEMVEDSRGLRVKGKLLLTTQDGRETYELMRAGALDSMSIGYRPTLDEIDRTTGVRRILKADLREVSIVTFPMNERCTVGAVKTMLNLSSDDLRDLEAALRDEGLSRTDAVTAVSGFKAWLQRDAGVSDRDQRDAVTPAQVAAAHAVFEEFAKRLRA